MELNNPVFVPRRAIARVRPRIEETRCAGLFVSGTLESLAAPAVAVVGSRAPSEAGLRLARKTASTLARSGVCVVSGLALGIDGGAHEGALDERAPTIGVLGGGHRHFFPPRNRGLATRMVTGGGGVVSPFEPDDVARPGQFLQRNAIIAALCDAVVVVEAAERSGSLNTANWAIDLAIPVFAFPGDVDRPKVAGCLALIRDGATLVRSADDVLEGLGLRGAPAVPDAPVAIEFSPAESIVRKLRDNGIRNVDDLVVASGLHAATVAAAIVRLDLTG